MIMAVFVFCVLRAYSLEFQTGEKVSFVTSDGITICGLYRHPASSINRTFILLHGLGSSQEEWQSFADKLVSSGYGVLSYDARGHGKSTAGTHGRTISYNSFGHPGSGSEWEQMLGDLGKAVDFLNNEKAIPSNEIGLIGASLGANVVLTYASKHPEIPIVMLLSPGINYAGYGTFEPIKAFEHRTIALAASPQDTYAYQSSILLYQKIRDNTKAAFLTGTAGHGVQMFDGKFDNQLIKWLKAH